MFFKKKETTIPVVAVDFSKISWSQFLKDYRNLNGWPDTQEEKTKLAADLAEIYDKIQLPQRQTAGSAGYDFYLPQSVTIGKTAVTIPTGITARIPQGYFLALVPRSSLGFKFGVRLANTVGIIDSDYFFADNEGHIMCRMLADKQCKLNAGDRFVQGIVIPYAVGDDNPVNQERNGGMGSTGK